MGGSDRGPGRGEKDSGTLITFSFKFQSRLANAMEYKCSRISLLCQAHEATPAGVESSPGGVYVCVYPVGFPSVCCEYVLLLMVHKEAILAFGRAESSRAGRDT